MITRPRKPCESVGSRRARLLLVLTAAVCAPLADGRAASREPVRARRGIVASADALASRAGVRILEQGGNAVDAAVAVGFALAVTYPSAGNVGGGGFMLIRLADGRETTIDYREVAPAAASRDMFLDDRGEPIGDRSRVGPLSVGVPGTVAGLAMAQRKYGRLSLADVMAPAIALARDGFTISWHGAALLESHQALLSRFPATARVLLRPDGSAPAPGEQLVQPDLAVTLQEIAAHGPDAFYSGRVAGLVTDEMSRTGGLVTKADLTGYRAVERPPLTGTYRGYRIVSMGPPSSGGVALLQLLNILEAYPLAEYGHNSSRTMHLMIESERRVYADRSKWLGDPAFYRVPITGLVAKAYAAHLRDAITPTRATPSSEVAPGRPQDFEPSQTTHFSVVDADGNAVSTTTTLNGAYGSGQMVTGAGFLLNNEMDDFSAKPGAPNMFGLTGGEANEVAPGKRMLSSMTPTIVLRDGRTWLVVGSPGGGRIITTVLQVIVNAIDHGMNLQQAVDAPRFHHQWQPDEVRLERIGFPADVVTALEAMGHTTRFDDDMGDVQAAAIDVMTGVRLGASDPREDGLATGY
jgi:gamma-glutamyltranspeptidase / glutathione hydrolase